MAGKKGGENTKKLSGNAKKAEAAAQKQALVDAQSAAAEDQEWSTGAKANAKKEAEASKKAEAARKKAERDALLAAEESSQPAVPKSAKAKTAPKKSKGTLDLSQLSPNSNSPTSPFHDDDSTTAPTLNATGIDNALDALSLTSDPNALKTDRHPERRYKAAYAAFEARRLEEIATEHPGLRKQQRVEICRREFEKSEENPFNKAGVVEWDAGKEEVKEVKEAVRRGVEGRLGEQE